VKIIYHLEIVPNEGVYCENNGFLSSVTIQGLKNWSAVPQNICT